MKFISMCILLGFFQITAEGRQMTDQFVTLKNEQKIFDGWIKENVNLPNALNPFVYEGYEFPFESLIEGTIKPIIHTATFYIIYIEKNVNSGVFDIFFLNYSDENWHIISWRKIDPEDPKSGISTISSHDPRKIIRAFELLENISVDLDDYRYLDSRSSYLAIQRNGEMKRIAVYNPDFTGLQQFTGDQKILLKIERILEKYSREKSQSVFEATP